MLARFGVVDGRAHTGETRLQPCPWAAPRVGRSGTRLLGACGSPFHGTGGHPPGVPQLACLCVWWQEGSGVSLRRRSQLPCASTHPVSVLKICSSTLSGSSGGPWSPWASAMAVRGKGERSRRPLRQVSCLVQAAGGAAAEGESQAVRMGRQRRRFELSGPAACLVCAGALGSRGRCCS